MSAVLIAAVAFVGCADQRKFQPPEPPPPPARPLLEGAFRTLSSADIAVIRQLTRGYIVKEYGSALPIYSVYVIDRDHVTVSYWAQRQHMSTYLARARGHWKIIDTEGERIITTGRNLPTS